MVPLAILAPLIHVKALNLGSTPNSGANGEVRGNRAVGKRVPWTSAKAERELAGSNPSAAMLNFIEGGVVQDGKSGRRGIRVKN